MTSKEKAKEIFLDYIGIFQESDKFNVGDNIGLLAKVCSYKLVNEFIDWSQPDHENQMDGLAPTREFWEQVKLELENI